MKLILPALTLLVCVLPWAVESWYYGGTQQGSYDGYNRYSGQNRASPKPKTSSRKLQCNGYYYGWRHNINNDLYRLQRHLVSQLDWKSYSVWRCVAYELDLHKKEIDGRYRQKIPSYKKCEEDSSNLRCHVCFGEKNKTECLNNGWVEECVRGQDACIFQTHEVDGVQLLWRRCGNLCECGPEDYVHYYGPEPDFYQYKYECADALAPEEY